jgi:hypothetical protein
VITSSNGNVSEAKIVSSSNYPALDQAALAAARNVSCPTGERRRVRLAINFAQEGTDFEREARQRQEEAERQQQERERQAELERQRLEAQQQQQEEQQRLEEQRQQQQEQQRLEEEQQRQQEQQQELELPTNDIDVE